MLHECRKDEPSIAQFSILTGSATGCYFRDRPIGGLKPLNETHEAYTGNYIVRKGVRISLKQFSFVSACEINTVGDRLNITGNQYKGTVRKKSDGNRLHFCGQGSGGAVGVKEHGMYREKHQELGRSTLLLLKKVTVFNYTKRQ